MARPLLLILDVHPLPLECLHVYHDHLIQGKPVLVYAAQAQIILVYDEGGDVASTTEELLWLVEWHLHIPSLVYHVQFYYLIGVGPLLVNIVIAHGPEEEVALVLVNALTQGENSVNLVVIGKLLLRYYLEDGLSQSGVHIKETHTLHGLLACPSKKHQSIGVG